MIKFKILIIILKYLIFNHADTWGEFMGAKVVPPFPPFFQIPRILRKGAIDPVFKNENIKKRRNICMVSVVR